MFDTEKFIYEVEKRPGLYNLKSKEYSNRDVKAKLWDDIGAEMYENWDEKSLTEKNSQGRELQIKWKSIRDHYRKELNAEKKTKSGEPVKKKKKYIYYDQLKFLKNYLERRPISSNFSNESREETEIIELEVDPISEIQISDDHTPRISKKRPISQNRNNNKIQNNKIAKDITSILSKTIALQKQDRLNDLMGNKAFLMSLLPTLNQMTQDQTLYVRFKIMELMQQLRISNYQPNDHTLLPSTNFTCHNRFSLNMPSTSTQPAFNPLINPSIVQPASAYTCTPSAKSPTDDSRSTTTITSEDSQLSPIDLYNVHNT